MQRKKIFRKIFQMIKPKENETEKKVEKRSK